MLEQALAARKAHEALLELKRFIDEVTQSTHTAEVEAFYVATIGAPSSDVQRRLQSLVNRLKAPNVDALLSEARESLETAASIPPAAARRAG
jgi:hypothetical protein